MVTYDSQDRTSGKQFCRAGRRAVVKRGERGAQLLEFSLVLLPMVALLGVTLDMAWAIFAQSTLQWAVRNAAHSGSNMAASQLASGACLTGTVKALVQSNALGL